ncbi:MAG: tRNA preQ1(34) S-adenosylmethionine ribosyltransferase-isomerase QueA [Acidobacteria bacterium]|jgi:S-adenosylmethionine:tRNA ribosyltransferase-isomerase|nr:tRNA preQ1(34) S-adenosylmethionine ribosyltransferase-isomerase QueA [Acidobacteriota bacterium]
MLISEFDYELPEELIAQNPLERRDISQMLVVNRAEKSFQDKHFYNFPQFLKKDDVIVLNNTKVFPARLFGISETGAKIEVFLVREIENQIWETLARPARRLKTGRKIIFGENLTAEVLEKTKEGRVVAKFETDGDFNETLDKIGQTPLPPYIKREQENPDKDRERYQTVFAKRRGAIAAPTAGLHFTPQILEKIKNLGVCIVEITLHVGYGTFEPVRVSDLSEHKVFPELCEISAGTAEFLNKAKIEKRKIIAVGTTTTRALESSINKNGKISAGKRLANLTITPNYKFKAINGLLTNFHLPQSSLLVLVSTFGGYELIMKAYKRAVRLRYRFYSYGDCMLIL